MLGLIRPLAIQLQQLAFVVGSPQWFLLELKLEKLTFYQHIYVYFCYEVLNVFLLRYVHFI